MKGVGDEHGSWAHFIYTAYPRRAENALPSALRDRLDELAKRDAVPRAAPLERRTLAPLSSLLRSDAHQSPRYCAVAGELDTV